MIKKYFISKVIYLLKSLEMFIKKIFAKRIFLNPFKIQFEIKALVGSGKTTACSKFAKRMIKKNRIVIWIIPHSGYKCVVKACLPIKYSSKIVFYIEEGTERYLTDIIHSMQLCGIVKGKDKIAFIIDEVPLIRTPAIHKIVKEFCKQNGMPYIFTSS